MKIRSAKLSGIAGFLGAVIIMMSTAMANARTIVYISNADSHEIYVLELDETDGACKLIEKVPVTGSVMPLAISPNHKYLYASLRSEPYSVSSFAIDQNSGRLTLVKTAPLADNMAYISTDRRGRYLFGASYGGNKISINSIESNGEVDPKPLHVVPTGEKAHAIVIDSSNKFLFVPNLGDDMILQYRFDETSGSVTPNDPPAVRTRKGAGPRHFAFHPNGHLAFSINELDGTVSTYALHVSGTLTLLSSISIMPPDFKGGAPAAAQLHLTPDGRFLFASERTSSTIEVFGVDNSSGKLTSVGSYATETQPRGFDVDPAGKYLVAVGQKSNGLSTYAIDQKTGALHKLSHMEAGKNPNWVEIVALPR